MFVQIWKSLIHLTSNRKSSARKLAHPRRLTLEGLEKRTVCAHALFSVIDLRMGQLTTTSTPVAVSSSLQNGEQTVVVGSHRPVSKTIQAEGNASLHQTGRREGNGWSVDVNDTPNRFMVFGQRVSDIPPGNRTATFTLKVDNVSADNHRILTIDVFDANTGKVIAKRDIHRKDFSRPFEYQDFKLGFKANAGQRLEFRTYWHGGAYVQQDKVGVR